MMGIYGLFLIAALAVGCAVYAYTAKREGVALKTLPLLAAAGALMGALCGRLYLHLAKYTVNGMGLYGFTPLSSRPYEYAACGVILGVLLTAALTAKAMKQRVMPVFDALAPAGLLALAVARFGEHFSDFGWGPVFENEFWHFFPVAVPDMYEQWHLAVYLLEGVFALAVGVYALRVKTERSGDRFLTALLWFAASQIFCESMRTETIRWGFVRVQQLQCAVFMLIVLLVYALRVRGEGKGRLTAYAAAAFVLGIGAVVFAEYALDKIDALSTPVCYALMAAALIGMSAVIARLGRAKKA